MSTLYRKYRPSNFEEVVGQNHIKITLENEIKAGKIAHAYLFCGPRAVGKTTMARIFAKAINCLDRKKDKYNPCGKCEMCKDISAGKCLDIIEIDAASHTGVDNVRENIIAASRVAPNKAKYKVFIIDEVHMLSIGAFNALLKIMEEPPENVIFILCTTEVHKVPTTIISRCQRFDFKRISVKDIVKKLLYIANEEGIEIEKDILEDIAQRSEGHMRDAESILGQIVAIGGKKITRKEADLVIPRSNLDKCIAFIDLLFKKDAAGAINLINILINEGGDLINFVENIIKIVRKIMFIKISPNLNEKVGIEMGENLELKINNLSKKIEINKIINILEKLMQVKEKINKNFIIQLPLEIAIVDICFNEKKIVIKKEIAENYNISHNYLDSTNVNNLKNNSTPSSKQVTNDHKQNNNLHFNNIKDKWNEFLTKIKHHNHSLSFILQVCEPKNFENNKLCLAFKYKFHQERINEPNIKILVEKILHEVYGAQIELQTIIDEEIEINNNKPINTYNKNYNELKKEKKENNEENMMDNLLKTFGGRIIN